MAKNKKVKKIQASGEGGMVYSTNPQAMNDWSAALMQLRDGDVEDDSGDAVRIGLEKKGRGGKWVSIVRGLTESQLAQYEKSIKAHCAVGGSIKDGELILQGDVRDKVITFLGKQGIQAKKAGG